MLGKSSKSATMNTQTLTTIWGRREKCGSMNGRVQDIPLEGRVQCSLLVENPVVALCLSNQEMSIHKMISGLVIWASQCSTGQSHDAKELISLIQGFIDPGRAGRVVKSSDD